MAAPLAAETSPQPPNTDLFFKQENSLIVIFLPCGHDLCPHTSSLIPLVI